MTLDDIPTVTLPPEIPSTIADALTSSNPRPGKLEAFTPYIDRYAFDFNLPYRRGWAQLDTEQDASYYGHWANPWRRQVLYYAEGDITLETKETDAAFTNHVRVWANWCKDHLGETGRIDAMTNDQLVIAFTRLELADLLH